VNGNTPDTEALKEYYVKKGLLVNFKGLLLGKL
jgi:hypothetical protein